MMLAPALTSVLIMAMFEVCLCVALVRTRRRRQRGHLSLAAAALDNCESEQAA